MSGHHARNYHYTNKMSMVGDYRGGDGRDKGGHSDTRRGFGRKSGGRTYGTELDPVNCSFFLRTGCCRHGDSCPKEHSWPPFGTTILFQHLWIAPKRILAKKKARSRHYDAFVEDLLEECLKYGHVSNILTVANMGDHMVGNTFVRFEDEEQAAKCLAGLTGRYYAGRKVHAVYSPVVDLNLSQCRDYELDSCTRGQFCNFAHFMPLPRWVHKALRDSQFNYQSKSDKELKRNHALKSYDDGWPKFPIHGSRVDRVKCIASWNLLHGRWDEDGKRKLPVVDKLNHGDKKFPDTKPGLNLFKPGDK